MCVAARPAPPVHESSTLSEEVTSKTWMPRRGERERKRESNGVGRDTPVSCTSVVRHSQYDPSTRSTRTTSPRRAGRRAVPPATNVEPAYQVTQQSEVLVVSGVGLSHGGAEDSALVSCHRRDSPCETRMHPSDMSWASDTCSVNEDAPGRVWISAGARVSSHFQFKISLVIIHSL